MPYSTPFSLIPLRKGLSLTLARPAAVELGVPLTFHPSPSALGLQARWPCSASNTGCGSSSSGMSVQQYPGVQPFPKPHLRAFSVLNSKGHSP